MPIEVSVGKKNYESTKKNHGEEVMFNSGRHSSGNFTVEMNGWPCTGEHGHDCHALFTRQSTNRIITVNVTGDHAGYSANHGKPFGASGTITYNNRVATYS